jgi:hypothetical protein
MESGIPFNSCCETPHLKMEFLVQKVMKIGRTQTPILVKEGWASLQLSCGRKKERKLAHSPKTK